jgi:hypothetical protein
MPLHLRYELNNILMSQKMKDDIWWRDCEDL